MKIFKQFILAAVLAVGLSSCIPSLYPLYKQENLISSTQLVGDWETADQDQWNFAAPVETGSFTYELSIAQNRAFETHLVKLGDNHFMNFYPLERGADSFNHDEFYASHFLPIHTFAKVEVSANELKVWFFDTEWLASLLEQRKIRIRHEVLEYGPVLSASTDELQKFLLKYADHPDAYLDPVTFNRRAK